MYVTGKKYSDAWLSDYDADYDMWYDDLDSNTASDTLDLTEYNPTVSQFYIDPTTRV